MLTIEGEKALDELIADMREFVPKEEWPRIYRLLLKRIATMNRIRINAQRNLDRSKFAPRKDKDNKKKLLKRIIAEKGKKGRGQVFYKTHSEGGEVIAPNWVAVKHHTGDVSLWKKDEQREHT